MVSNKGQTENLSLLFKLIIAALFFLIFLQVGQWVYGLFVPQPDARVISTYDSLVTQIKGLDQMSIRSRTVESPEGNVQIIEPIQASADYQVRGYIYQSKGKPAKCSGGQDCICLYFLGQASECDFLPSNLRFNRDYIVGFEEDRVQNFVIQAKTTEGVVVIDSFYIE